jgi:hypothetical protein
MFYPLLPDFDYSNIGPGAVKLYSISYFDCQSGGLLLLCQLKIYYINSPEFLIFEIFLPLIFR